jgi:HSP20 family protein
MKLSDRIEQMVNQPHGFPQEIDNLLEHLFGHKSKSGQTCQTGKPNQKTFSPRTNIVEREKEFVVTLELPGVEVADVTVEATDEKLRIAGEKRFGFDAESDKLHRRERATGKFERSFEFPTQVDFDLINAEFKLGVLSVSVPKSEKVLPRKIEINVSE